MISSNSEALGYEECMRFLNLRTKPALYFFEQVAWRLNFSKTEVGILVGIGLLKVAGNPADNAKKKIAGCDVERHAADSVWLSKAVRAIQEYWADKNAKQKRKLTETSQKFPKTTSTTNNSKYPNLCTSKKS